MRQTAPYQAHLDEEASLREEAVNRYIAGQSPSEIARQLGRSRAWFYQVLTRYRTGGRAALTSQSRAPRHVHNQTAANLVEAVVRIRKLIETGEDPELCYANLGADSIAAELLRSGLNPPSRATINRILRRKHLSKPRARKKQKKSIPEDYPWPAGPGPNQIHLFDFVRRSLVGSNWFYSCHLLDLARRWPFLRVILSKNADAVIQFLASAWQEIGLPAALYLDNDIVWGGSGFQLRTISRVVRFCLWVGVEVIFIPIYTPEANPVMESFNSVWDRNFWERRHFDSFSQVEAETPGFTYYCRTRRPLEEFHGCTADQLFPDFVPCCLPAEILSSLPKKLPVTEGLIHFIRFVDAKGGFSFLNETWQIDRQWAGKTIRATVNTAQQQMQVFYRQKPALPCQEITRFPYPLREKVLPLQAAFVRPPLDLWV